MQHGGLRAHRQLPPQDQPWCESFPESNDGAPLMSEAMMELARSRHRRHDLKAQ